ncbi:MAG: hypothetical protein M3082_22490 [Candidatus Dormibacteraeota bacterium]|nr:hypothetical protein [Candidatus Dormibacteraeota bacterium]
MDDFDRLLEFQLRRKLDAVAAAPVPVRRGAGSGRVDKGRREEVAIKRMGAIVLKLRPAISILVQHS